MMRKTKTDYYLDIAKEVSSRSTCLRRHYGAVIVKDDVIVATGYNGSARGEKNCCDVGRCARMERNAPHGSEYVDCCAIHAENNALMACDAHKARGAILYLAGFEDGKIIDAEPCVMCKRLIKNAGIEYWIGTKKYEQNV